MNVETNSVVKVSPFKINFLINSHWNYDDDHPTALKTFKANFYSLQKHIDLVNSVCEAAVVFT